MLAELQLEYCGSFPFYPDQYQHWLKLICFQHCGGGGRKKNAASKISCKKDATPQYTEGKVQKCQACNFKFLSSYIKLSV